ncbi:MAG: tetratricopeptide repeat protein [Deltaproteobacteria bacterium]|nr:tetratricopeptide repeat protein [Deltaproteobacteria bacterium]
MEQFATFVRSDPGDQWLLWVSGLGGVGKTTLLFRFEEIGAAQGVPMVTSDNHQQSVLEVLVHFRDALKRAGLELTLFSSKYHRYEDLRHAMLTDSSRPEKLFEWLGHTAGKLASLVSSADPQVKVAMEAGGKNATAYVTQEIARYVYMKFSHKDASLVTQPIPILTEAFVTDLVATAKAKRIVLCWDVFEQTRAFLEPWLLNSFLPSLSAVDGVLLVISGREEFTDAWFKYRPVIRHIRLCPFSSEECNDFLARKGITASPERAMLLRSTRGLPLLLEWETLLPSAAEGGDGIVDRFLNAVTEHAMKASILMAAIPRRFNKDIIRSLDPPCDIEEVFATSSTLPGVRMRGDLWEFHEIIRDALIDYKRKESPSEFMTLHRKVLKYYADRIDELQAADAEFKFSDEWWPLEIQRLYHELTANANTALPCFYSRFAYAIAEQSEAVLHGLTEVATAVKIPSGHRAQVATILALQQAIDDRKFDDTVDDFDFLASQPEVPTAQRCMIIRATATILRKGSTDPGGLQAKERLKQAIELMPKDTRAYADLAELYVDTDRINDAVDVYRLLVSNDPASTVDALYAIGRVRLGAKQYSEVEQTLTQLRDEAPGCFEEHALNAMLQEKIDCLDEALKTHALIADKFPKYRPDAYSRIAAIHMKRNVWELVRQAGQDAVHSDPESALGYVILIRYFDNEGDFESQMLWIAKLVPRSPVQALMIGMQKQIEAIAEGRIDRVLEIAERLEKASVDEDHLCGAAMQWRLLGDTTRATEVLQRVLRQNPSSIVAYCNLGDIFWDSGDLETAARYFERALTVNNELPAITVPLRSIYKALNRDEDATKLPLESRYVGSPVMRFVQHSLAGRCHIPEQCYEVKEDISRHIRANPSDTSAQLIFYGIAMMCDCVDEILMGIPTAVSCMFGEHDYVDALRVSVQHFTEAALPESRAALARAMLAPVLGDFNRAKELLRSIADDSREFLGERWFYLGFLSLLSRNMQDAQECFQEAQSLFPSFFPINICSAVLLAEKGSHDQFATAARQVIESDPAHINALVSLLTIRELFDSLAKSAELIRGDQNEHIEILGGIGLTLMGAGRLGAAEACFSKIIENHPETQRAYLDLDDVYRRKNATEKRIQVLEGAIEISTHFPECLKRLASAYKEMGDAEGTKRTLKLIESTTAKDPSLPVKSDRGAEEERQSAPVRTLGT